MISQNRWMHILGVAQKANFFAKKIRPDMENFAEDMFVLGVMHDLGYEFSQNNKGHARIGGEILKRVNYKYWQEVSLHGTLDVDTMNDEQFILNCADMMVNSEGKDCSMEDRLQDIASRYGQKSTVYQDANRLMQKLQNDQRYKIIRML